VDEKNRNSYDNRQKRFSDAIELKVPDRVPVTASFYFFPARYYGCTMQEMMYDPEKLYDFHLRVIREFEPDVAQNPFGQLFLGPLLDSLDYRQMQWPGRHLGADVPYQFVEGEYMLADEYQSLFSDPMDFVMRRYWPRISGELKGLERLVPFSDFTTYMSHRSFGIFDQPEVLRAFEAIIKAGKESVRMADYSRRFIRTLEEEGFPSQGGGQTTAPFDFLGDALRGTKGLMLDMYRRPETVVKACEFLLPILVERGVRSGKASKTGLVFIALHKGLDGFMSGDQFDRFYWPTLKELIASLIREKLTPYLFWEGDCTSRLEKIKDIPEGKAVYRFEGTDVMKAKDILRGRACIWGSVPVSLLSTGTPEDVKGYCRKLIDYVGEDGGFIMDASAHITDAKPENVRTMFDFTREHGVY
jgi:uroporphyrinogen-III decarboxylase